MGQTTDCPRCLKRISKDLTVCPLCETPRPSSGWPSFLPGTQPWPAKALKKNAPSAFIAILKRHQGRNIGINLKGPSKFDRVYLVGVGDDYFTVFVGDRGTLIHFPLTAVGSIIEAEEGNVIQGDRHYRLMVGLHPSNFPPGDGAWFVGFSMPLG
jgi:hypothetical protein